LLFKKPSRCRLASFSLSAGFPYGYKFCRIKIKRGLRA
jgi:hypothetical protein